MKGLLNVDFLNQIKYSLYRGTTIVNSFRMFTLYSWKRKRNCKYFMVFKRFLHVPDTQNLLLLKFLSNSNILIKFTLTKS